MKRPMEVGTVIVPNATKARGKFRVDEFSTGTEVYIPYVVINGKEDGPVIWVNACIHGNELNGMLAAQRIASTILPEEVHGGIIVTPLSNPLAFREKKRTTGLEDDTNLGECFPGRMDGNMTEKLAYVLFEQITKHATALIDFHCWGFGQDSKPYTVIKVYDDPVVSCKTLEMAKAFGSPLICKLDLTKRLDEPSPVDRQLDVLCAQYGIPGFMAETGHSAWAEEEYIEFSVKGAKNVMKYFGVLKGEVSKPPKQVVLSSRQVIRCKHDGLAIAQVKPHQPVKKGECISKILNAYGDVVEEVIAQNDLFTISLPYQPNVNGGERVAFVGIIE